MGLVRMLLALAVLGHHAYILDWEILSGDDAVRGFFIISGFYMALILNGEYARRPLGLFWSNRALRLYPAYAVVLLLSLAALLVLDLHPFAGRDRMAALLADNVPAALLLAWTNVMVLGQEWLFSLGLAPLGKGLTWAAGDPSRGLAFVCSLVPQAWTLSLEFAFYLAAPWLVRQGARRAVLVLAASLGLRLGFWLLGPAWNRFSHYFLPTELYLFMAGALAWMGHQRVRGRAWVRRAGPPALAVVAAMVLGWEGLPLAWRFPLFAIGLASALPLVFDLTARNRLDRVLGELSYPFYLVHFLIIAAVEAYAPDLLGPALIGLVLAAAMILYLAVDRPLNRLRRRRLERARPGTGTSASLSKPCEPGVPIPLPALGPA